MDIPLHAQALNFSESPDSKACWSLIERIVESPQFKRAARMREFLRFVGQRSLKDGCDQIHEQEIGSEVFGRPANYDTSADNIVRVNAYELRKRIGDYFESEGAAETLILEIPRGSYKPVFRQREIQSTIPTEESANVLHLPKVQTKSPRAVLSFLYSLLALAGVCIVALIICCCVLWTENRAMHRSLYAWRSSPSVNSFWSGFLSARPNTDVILADTSFALIEDITKKPIPLSDYLSHNYIHRIQSEDFSQDRRDDLDKIMMRDFGSLGDFRTAQRIAVFDPLGKTIHLYSARNCTPELVKQDNIILIGSRKSDPWVDLFSGSMNFTAEYDPNRPGDYIKNHAPVAGEQEIYASDGSSPNTSYGVVAYLPNTQQTGRVLILAGTDSVATEGVGEFLTSENQLARFQKMLNVAALPYFEVLLKTTRLNGTPIDITIVAYRTYPNLH